MKERLECRSETRAAYAVEGIRLLVGVVREVEGFRADIADRGCKIGDEDVVCTLSLDLPSPSHALCLVPSTRLGGACPPAGGDPTAPTRGHGADHVIHTDEVDAVDVQPIGGICSGAAVVQVTGFRAQPQRRTPWPNSRHTAAAGPALSDVDRGGCGRRVGQRGRRSRECGRLARTRVELRVRQESRVGEINECVSRGA